MKELKLIPTNEIRAWWPTVKPFLRSIVGKVEATEEDVAVGLRTGQFVLFCGIDDARLRVVVIGQRQDRPTGTVFFVWLCAADSKGVEMFLPEFREAMTKVGIGTVEFLSNRPGFERANKFGARKVSTLYRMEV